MTERDIHLACLETLRYLLPKAIVHFSPNAIDAKGKDIARAIAKNKAMGMVVGWPDLVFLHEGSFYAMEVKAEGGRLSNAQKDVRDRFQEQGVPFAVVRSVDDVVETLEEWGL